MAGTPLERLVQSVKQQNEILKQQRAMIASLTAQATLTSFVAVKAIESGVLNMTAQDKGQLRELVARARQHASQAEGMGDLGSFIDFFATHAED